MKQDDYRKMCDEVKLSEEQKDKIWAAARTKVQAKKENRQKVGRFAGIAMAAAAIIVFFMVAAMPGIIKNKNTNKNTNQPAAQLEKTTEEDRSQPVQINQEMKYYLLLGTDGRTDKKAGTRADAIILAGIDASKGKIQLISIPRRLKLGEKEAGDYDWWYQSTNDLWSAMERNFGITIEGQVTASFSIFAQLVNMYGGLELEVTEADLDPTYSQLNGYLTEIVESTGLETKGQITELGVQLLDGPQTVAWCRVRDTENGVRGSRFLTALKQLYSRMAEQDNDIGKISVASTIILSMVNADVTLSNEPFEVAMIMEQAFFCTEFSYIDLAQSEYVEVVEEENSAEPVYTLSEEFYGISSLSVLN